MSVRWTAADLPDQSGRTIIVTGASSGLGIVVARELARVGARVVLAVRNPAKGEQAAADMAGQTEVRRLDLASVCAFANKWDEPLDVLINNAGIMRVPEGRTRDGFELQIGTNYLGPFALTNLLLAHVTSRVVTVSSQLHRRGRLDLDDLNWQRRRYQSLQAYCDSKLANGVRFADGDGQGTVRYQIRNPDPVVSTGATEFALALLLRRARHATGHPVTPVHVGFAAAAPSAYPGLAAEFGTRRLDFDADSTTMTFRRADLDRPLVRADPVLAGILRREADVELTGIQAIPQWIDMFREVLATCLMTRPSFSARWPAGWQSRSGRCSACSSARARTGGPRSIPHAGNRPRGCWPRASARLEPRRGSATLTLARCAVPSAAGRGDERCGW
jgi:hypothetical protein